MADNRLEKVRKEIERERLEVKNRIIELGNFESKNLGLFDTLEIYDNILSFMDSTQEEPKFKIGDTIIAPEAAVPTKHTIRSINGNNYILEDGCSFSTSTQDKWKLVEEPVSKVWHDASETPVASRTKIVLYTNDEWDIFRAHEAKDDYDNYWSRVNQCLSDNGIYISSWAYADDLLNHTQSVTKMSDQDPVSGDSTTRR